LCSRMNRIFHGAIVRDDRIVEYISRLEETIKRLPIVPVDPGQPFSASLGVKLQLERPWLAQLDPAIDTSTWLCAKLHPLDENYLQSRLELLAALHE
jgi:hypothetical protein